METSHERKQAIIDLCASAYPDVRPWQVESACRLSKPVKTSTDEDMKEFYYSYLTLLLHPIDGHDTARRDPSLVKVTILVVRCRLVEYFMMHSSTYTSRVLYNRNGANCP